MQLIAILKTMVVTADKKTALPCVTINKAKIRNERVSRGSNYRKLYIIYSRFLGGSFLWRVYFEVIEKSCDQFTHVIQGGFDLIGTIV